MFRSVGGKPPAVESQMKNQSAAAAQFAERRVAAAEEKRIRMGSPRRREIVKDCYFLDACALCKAEIHESQDRYMYGYLQAFCSIGCRDDQIAYDEMSKPPSPIRCANDSCSILGLNNSKPKKSRH